MKKKLTYLNVVKKFKLYETKIIGYIIGGIGFIPVLALPTILYHYRLGWYYIIPAIVFEFFMSNFISAYMAVNDNDDSNEYIIGGILVVMLCNGLVAIIFTLLQYLAIWGQ